MSLTGYERDMENHIKKLIKVNEELLKQTKLQNLLKMLEMKDELEIDSLGLRELKNAILNALT